MTLTHSIRLRVFALCAGALLFAPALRAQGTAIVPPSDLVYADIDRLAELGMLDSVIIGQRPYSRREIARIARIARDRLDRGGRGRVRFSEERSALGGEILSRIDRFSAGADADTFDNPVVSIVDGASAWYNSTDAARRGFPAPLSVATEATIDPLAVRRLGEFAERGDLVAMELSHRIEPVGWLAFQARERFEYRWPTDTTISDRNGELLLASMRARFRNVALTVGRQQFAWSQGAGDGLFLNADAPALDQISLAADHPFVLPSVLRYIGPVQATVILADLGPSVSRSHSKLLTYKVSVQPTRNLELGGTFMNHYGGSGARESSLGDRIVDFLPFIDVFRKHNYRDATRALDVDSDKLLGADGRLWLPILGGLTVTGELLIDDFDVNRIPKLLTGYGSQSVGIIVPQIGTPALSMKLSAKHMGILTYSHFDLRDGITTRGRLLGDELGPDSKSFSGQLRWQPSAGTRFEIEGRSAIYSNAVYRSFYSDPGETRFVVEKVSHTADELRDIVLGSLILQNDDGIALTIRGGGERIRNANFNGGRRRDYVAQVGLRFAQ
ncbi:MAG: capsule assembly Wzi family protein [bacterium]